MSVQVLHIESLVELLFEGVDGVDGVGDDEYVVTLSMVDTIIRERSFEFELFGMAVGLMLIVSGLLPLVCIFAMRMCLRTLVVL